MNILIVGGGGREHALAWKLSQSRRVERLFCAPGNAGTLGLGATNLPLAITDVPGLLAAAREHDIDFTVIGPDDALAAGVADAFEADDRRVFGPTRAAARLESSKIFTKELLARHRIPTAAAGVFSTAATARKFIAGKSYPIVIKADGLATGKGVIIAEDERAALGAVADMMEHGRFGEAGRRVVIEEFLVGHECSLHVLLDGRGGWRSFPAAQDHKRIFDGERGPNTGGMGTVSPPVRPLDAETNIRIESEILVPLTAALVMEEIDFRGLLFPGLMLTADGPKLLELNARFGDPETQVLLARLRGDLLPALEAAASGRLDRLAPLEFDPRPAVCVVLASAGYPGSYDAGRPIEGLDQDFGPDVHLFHAGTRRGADGRTVTAGGRVLGVTALGRDLADARARAYAAAGQIRFEGKQMRGDIGA